ncbi:MAG TPA: DNA primase, partial [Paracoccus sp. (in: a-proteobacteria)]|nr:DNA primase [Paracoccus sp. (in: a-proteobacteria)]
QRETEGRVFDSPERRAALDKVLADSIARIPDAGTRDHYTTEIKRKRWALFAPARNERGRFARRDAPGPPAPQTRASTLVASDPGGALIEAMILALCATYPELVSRIESRLDRLEPQDAGRAALVHDLLAGTESRQGRAALDAIMADPHVRATPAIARPAGAESAEQLLMNALDRIEAHRVARDEIARAEREIEGLTDEGLTWRVAQSARARQQADHPDMGNDSGVVGDQRALADQFAAIKAQAEALMRNRKR